MKAVALLLVATAATAGPLPASYTQLGTHKAWISPPMSPAKADAEWRALVDKPGLVPIIVSEPPGEDADFTPKKPLSLAAARAALAKVRQEAHAHALEILKAHPEIPADEAALYRNEFTAWTAALAKAAPNADDRKDAADVIAFDAQDKDPFDGKPVQLRVLVYAGTVDEVVTMYDGVEAAPEGVQFAPVLAAWKKAYGARPYAWDGSQWTLDVPRPPTKLSELRVVAADFVNACPYDRAGAGHVIITESASHVLARLEQKRWTCYWFLE